MLLETFTPPGVESHVADALCSFASPPSHVGRRLAGKVDTGARACPCLCHAMPLACCIPWPDRRCTVIISDGGGVGFTEAEGARGLDGQAVEGAVGDLVGGKLAEVRGNLDNRGDAQRLVRRLVGLRRRKCGTRVSGGRQPARAPGSESRPTPCPRRGGRPHPVRRPRGRSC